MKYTIVILFSFFFAMQCNAQIGIIFGYKTFNPKGLNDDFQTLLNAEPYPLAGWQIGVNYWFRLKKLRIEFLPEITTSEHKRNFNNSSFEHRQYGFHFNTDFYIFNLKGDCNCPTFSKDGNIFGKGFFLEVSPGAVYLYNKRVDKSFPSSYEGNSWVVGGSIGAGLDLGFSDIFTVTPIARLHHYPNFTWEEVLASPNDKYNLNQYFIGLRFRLHFDEMAKARYR